MRAVQAALALLLAAAGAKNHGDELALFVRQYAEKNDRKTVDVHRLAAAADAHRKRIRDHYGFGDDVGKKIDEFTTYGRGTKVLEQKLMEGIKRGEVRIAQLGISTTAGHDVYHNESFPHVFARHFGAVLRTEGINLQFRNHAVGGFGSMPSHTCVITMAGADNDVVAWDYQMMADRGSCAVEHFVRHLQTDGSAPAVLFWQGGVFLPKDDDHKKRVPAGSNAKQSCGGKWVVDSYSGVGAHSGDFGGLLVHLRRSGFEALKKGSEKLFHEGKGDPPRPDMSEPALPRRRLARHHPAAGLHRLWGLCWAHAYLGVLSRALRREALIEATIVSLPKRMGCEAALCDRSPTCLTSMRPRVGHALEDAVVSTNGWGPREDARWAAHPMGYVDRKVLFSSSATSGEATFAIDVKTSSRPLVACEAPCPWGRCPAGRLPLKGNVRWTLDGAAVALPAKPPAALKIYDVKDTCHVVIETLAAGRHVVGLTFAPPLGDTVEKAARGRKTGAPYAGLTHLIFY